jgi:excinuclease ABC subunit C
VEQLSIKMAHSEELLKQILSLPDNPGVYQYFNSDGEIIYVGKAKNLKKRVASYFSKVHDSQKTNVLVKNIASLKYIVVETEEDALLLENNLIKKLQPRYNILLKDGKTYPSICISNESFPRIFKTRNIIKNGSFYYGPYSSNYTINSILEIIHELFPIRTCKLQLTNENTNLQKFKVCLQYHIHKCNGPCEGKESIESYRMHIQQIKQIIEGDANEISKMLLDKMQNLAKEYKFEEAHLVKQKYELIENYKSKSIVANTIIENTDVFAYDENDNNAYINILRISKGCIIQGYTIEYKKKLDENKEDILATGIIELREKLSSNSKEIILPFEINYTFKNTTFIIPQKGDKKKLLELAIQNVKQYKLDKLKQAEKLNPDQRIIRILSTAQKELGLDSLPMHIECFDNSNIQGTNPVAACVVFKRAKPSKKDYRHFNIKTVEGPNDYASMYEVVHRRYRRMLEEEVELPQLIIIDGGKGQLGMAVTAINDLEIQNKVAIISVAKRLEEIFFPGDPIPLYLDKNSETLKLIQQLRDEAHRFGITHHRNKRSKTQVASELDSIKNIGEKTKKELIHHFKSVKRIKSASKEELAYVIGNNRGSIVYEHFNSNISS